MRETEQYLRELLPNALASSVSVTMVIFIFNPLDCLRIRWQVAPSYQSASTVARGIRPFAHDIIKTEGLWKGLWKPGCLTNASSIAMSTCIRLTIYPFLRDYLDFGLGRTEKSPVTMFCAGLMVGGVGYFTCNPLFQLKTRMQAEAGVLGADGVLRTGARAQHRPRFFEQGMLAGVSRIYRSDGVRGLYRGANALVIRGALLTAGQQLGYDGCKTVFKRNDWMEDGVPLHLTGSLMAAFFATTCSAPADLILTRYQAAPEMGIRYRGLLHCTRDIVQKEGAMVLFRGWVPFFVRLAPLYSVFLPLYEQCRKALSIGYFD